MTMFKAGKLERGVIMCKVNSLIVVLLVIGFCGNVFAGGLSTSFGDIFIENLQIGEEYSTKELINLPLMIRNDSPFEVDLRVEIMLPNKSDIRDGFEPLPDASWIQLERSSFTVKPGQYGQTDVVISIPKDKKLKGKQYQLYLHTYTVPTKERNISVGLASRLSFTVAVKKGMRKNKLDTEVFVMKPDNLFLVDVELGKKVDVWKEKGKALEIFNPNRIECTYKIESISVKEAGMNMRKGFEEIPDTGFLTFDEKTKKVLPKSSKKLLLFLDIPNKPEYSMKNYMFVVKARQVTGKISITVLSKMYIMTR